jgi:ATP/maltotriose-dependent transcriptional regulator MalT
VEKNYAPRNRIIDLDRVDGLKIVGDCHINNNSYLIIEVDKNCEASIKSKLAAVAPDLNIRLTHFEIDGQMLAIIQAASDPNLKPEIATLLTARELQIATLVAIGNGNKKIASQLSISAWTVSTHLRRIFVKLGVDSRAAMVYRCADLLPLI